MSREWKPGDVAAIPFSRGWVRCIYTPGGWVPSDNNSDPAIKGYEDVRPLVVIDPEDHEQVERLWALYEDIDRGTGIEDMQAALREFANPKPPKPEEPMGLGAVVEDADGLPWIRIGDGDYWRASYDAAQRRIRSALWDDIAAVRVLSEGVQS